MPYAPYLHCPSCRMTVHRFRGGDDAANCPRCASPLKASPRRLFGRLPGLTLTPVASGGVPTGGRNLTRSR
jgi:uncharacterized paraquat-inducible protein A